MPSNNLYGFPQPLSRVFPPPIIAQRAPLTSDIAYPLGQEWVDAVGQDSYILVNVTASSATWNETSTSPGQIATLTGDSGGAIAPSASNINLLGTANQITTTGSGAQIAWTLSATIVAPGSIVSTTTIASGTTLTAGTSLAVTTSATVGTTLGVTGLSTLAALTQVGTTNINASGAAVTTIGTGGTGAVAIGNATGNSAITGALTISTTLGVTGLSTLAALTAVGTANINASGSAVTTIGTGGTGAVAIGNATGNTAVTGSLTASTTLTATLGNITATAGNVVMVAAASGLVMPVSTAAGAASGAVTCNARVGTVTFTSPSIAAGADQTLIVSNSSVTGSGTRINYFMRGSTTGSALGVKSVTNSASTSTIVVTNGTGATTQVSDITFDFIVMN